MSNNREQTLEERLARRRRLRNRKLLGKTKYVDESEISVINRSPTATQSLDRKSSKRTHTETSSITPSAISTLYIDQRRSQSSIPKTPESLSFGNSSSKLDDTLSSETTKSSPFLSKLGKVHSLDAENDKQASSDSVPIHSHQLDNLQQSEQLTIHHEAVTSTQSQVIPDSHTEKSNAMTPVTLKDSVSSSQPITRPQSSKYNKQSHFNDSEFDSQPIQRATSEKYLPKHKHRHQLIDPKFEKLNSLAVSYLFSKRISTGLALASPHDNQTSQRKTDWD